MKRRFFLLTDFCVFFIILFFAVSVRRLELNALIYLNNCKVFLFVFAFSTFALWLFSFYDIKSLRKQRMSYKSLGLAFLLATFLSVSFFYFLSGRLPLLTPKSILMAVLLLYFAYAYWARKYYFKLDFAKTNLLLFGQSPTLDEIAAEAASAKGFSVRAYEPQPQPDKTYSLRNLDLVVVGSKLFIDNPAAWQFISDKFIAKGAYVDTDFNVFERIFRRVSRESISDGMWLLRGIGSRRESTPYTMFKRVLDLGLGLCMLPFLAVLGGGIYLLIKYIDHEDPIFTQKRIGYMGKTITIYKFRTIKQQNQESDKEQITRTGAWLRRFRLDEIPQIINVLQGDLSLVGPRPLWVGEWNILNAQIPNHTIRTIVKPGITGWAQLNFKAPPNYKIASDVPDARHPLPFDGAFTRFSYDVWYIKNRSVWLDMEILVKTGLRMFIKDSYVAS